MSQFRTTLPEDFDHRSDEHREAVSVWAWGEARAHAVATYRATPDLDNVADDFAQEMAIRYLDVDVLAGYDPERGTLATWVRAGIHAQAKRYMTQAHRQIVLSDDDRKRANFLRQADPDATMAWPDLAAAASKGRSLTTTREDIARIRGAAAAASVHHEAADTLPVADLTAPNEFGPVLAAWLDDLDQADRDVVLAATDAPTRKDMAAAMGLRDPRAAKRRLAGVLAAAPAAVMTALGVEADEVRVALGG